MQILQPAEAAPSRQRNAGKPAGRRMRPIINNSEIKLVNAVLKSPILTHGKRAEEFENAFSSQYSAPQPVCECTPM